MLYWAAPPKNLPDDLVGLAEGHMRVVRTLDHQTRHNLRPSGHRPDHGADPDLLAEPEAEVQAAAEQPDAGQPDDPLELTALVSRSLAPRP